jgi:FAD/FMN-containing dehydrogenases
MDLGFLRRVFGDRFVEDSAVASLYARDASMEGQQALGVVFPVDEEEVVELVRWAVKNRVPLFPQGSATSLSGNAAATAHGVVVSFEKMIKLEVDPVDGVAVVGPGVRLEELNHELARYGLFFPVDPGSVKSATIGGAIANGAGGMRGAKYGTMRDWVLGLRVVTGRGDVLQLGCRTYKCRNGYDLVRLFVGSEGTLGLITEAVLRLFPVPESAVALLAYYDELDTLVEDVVKIRTSRIWPLFAEFLDAPTSALVGLEGEAHAVSRRRCKRRRRGENLAEAYVRRPRRGCTDGGWVGGRHEAVRAQEEAVLQPSGGGPEGGRGLGN